jgi:fumarate hydratase class II
MPVLNVDENIKKIEETIEKMHMELYRLEGSLRVFLSFKEAGLEEIDVPEKNVESQ